MSTERISEDELDRQFLASDPVRRAALDDDSVRSALLAVRTLVESRGVRRESPRRRRGPAFRRQRVALGLAASAVVLAASVVGVQSLVGSGGSSELFSVRPAIAAQLSPVARAAARQPTPRSGQWQYQETQTQLISRVSAHGARVAFSYTQTMQIWTTPGKKAYGRAPDGQFYGRERFRQTGDSFSFLTPQDKATYLANKSAFDRGFLGHFAMKLGVLRDTMSKTTFDSPIQGPWETKPPSNPQTLLSEMWNQRKVLSGAQSFTATAPANSTTVPTTDATTEPVNSSTAPPGGTATTSYTPSVRTRPAKWYRASFLFEGLTEFLQLSTSAQLRATAYRALAYLPYTTVLGQRTDHLGRTGLAVEFRGYSGGPETIIVSPTTGELLETDDTSAHAAYGLPAGTVIARYDYVSAIVGSPTALPAGGSQPFHGTVVK